MRRVKKGMRWQYKIEARLRPLHTLALINTTRELQCREYKINFVGLPVSIREWGENPQRCLPRWSRLKKKRISSIPSSIGEKFSPHLYRSPILWEMTTHNSIPFYRDHRKNSSSWAGICTMLWWSIGTSSHIELCIRWSYHHQDHFFPLYTCNLWSALHSSGEVAFYRLN